MTQLQRLALATLPLTQDDVERIYNAETVDAKAALIGIQRLCESHERLRAELVGAEKLIGEQDAEIKKLRKELAETQAALDSAESSRKLWGGR